MQTANDNKFNISRRTIIIAVVVFYIIIIGSVAAKYIFNENGQNLLHSKLFYFSSDLLAEDNPKYVLNSNQTDITFKVGNNKDKLNFSEVDIKYTVTVKCDGADFYTTEGVLANGMLSTADITLTGLQKGKKYTVTATGVGGYEKTLTAELTVSTDEENIYKHLDTSDPAFVLLTVWTKNIAGRVDIKVPDGLIADNTNPILEGIDNYDAPNYVAFDIEDTTSFTKTYSSYAYRFFKSTESSYDADNFDVTLNKNGSKYEAIEATP